VVAEKSFVVMMSVHCAGFYADSGGCQGFCNGCSAGCHPAPRWVGWEKAWESRDRFRL